jgi:fatty acid desaturase
MNARVSTPVSQALDEGRITRAELRNLMRRRDALPLLHLLAWCFTVAATGTAVWFATDTLWFGLAMFVHGVVLVHHFSLQHECTHYTAFRTRKLNDWVGAACGFIIMVAPRYFRYEHCDHHTWTQVTGRDPEQIPLPKTLGSYLWYLSSVPYWWAKCKEITSHAAGHLSDADKVFVPKIEYSAVIWEARVILAVYVAVVVAMLTFDWAGPLYYWFIPVLLGEPVMRFVRMTEHVGMPPVSNMRANTRTNLVSVVWQWLCWNMNYHAEHHYASSVPYHALPRMHELLAGELPVERGGYFAAHADMLAQLRGDKPRCDSDVILEVAEKS